MPSPKDYRLEVAWYKEPLGILTIQGDKWDWETADTKAAKMFCSTSGRSHIPTFLKYLKPEGWLAETLENDDCRHAYLKKGIRFLSNFTVVEEGRNNALNYNHPLDIHECTLRDFIDETGVFRGSYNGPTGAEVDSEFKGKVAEFWGNSLMPKFSGVQMKLPMHLYGGYLTPAERSAFTHFLKLPGQGYHEPLAAVEWMALELAERAGLETAAHALVDMPNGMAPAVLVERFDIPMREGTPMAPPNTPSKWMATQDFCTLGDIDPVLHKYGTKAEKCVEIVKHYSSNPEQDLKTLFKRNVFAWAILDTDMHLKNISMLRTLDRDTGQTDARFSPIYDPITTVVFPAANNRHMALPIGGRTTGFKMSDFVKFGRSCGLDEGEVREIVTDITESVAREAVRIASDPPGPIRRNDRCAETLKYVATEIVDQAKALGVKVPDWEPVYPDRAEFKRAAAAMKNAQRNRGFHMV